MTNRSAPVNRGLGTDAEFWDANIKGCVSRLLNGSVLTLQEDDKGNAKGDSGEQTDQRVDEDVWFIWLVRNNGGVDHTEC